MGAPVLRCLALEQGHEAGALHVSGNLGAGEIKKGLGKVEVGNDVGVHTPGLHHAGPADE